MKCDTMRLPTPDARCRGTMAALKDREPSGLRPMTRESLHAAARCLVCAGTLGIPVGVTMTFMAAGERDGVMGGTGVAVLLSGCAALWLAGPVAAIGKRAERSTRPMDPTEPDTRIKGAL